MTHFKNKTVYKSIYFINHLDASGLETNTKMNIRFSFTPIDSDTIPKFSKRGNSVVNEELTLAQFNQFVLSLENDIKTLKYEDTVTFTAIKNIFRKYDTHTSDNMLLSISKEFKVIDRAKELTFQAYICNLLEEIHESLADLETNESTHFSDFTIVLRDISIFFRKVNEKSILKTGKAIYPKKTISSELEAKHIAFDFGVNHRNDYANSLEEVILAEIEILELVFLGIKEIDNLNEYFPNLKRVLIM